MVIVRVVFRVIVVGLGEHWRDVQCFCEGRFGGRRRDAWNADERDLEVLLGRKGGRDKCC